MPSRPGPPNVDPARVAVLPSIGRLALTGAAAVLVPGLAVFLVASAAGLATGPAGLLGLLAMLCGMGAFPAYLRRLGRRLDP